MIIRYFHKNQAAPALPEGDLALYMPQMAEGAIFLGNFELENYIVEPMYILAPEKHGDPFNLNDQAGLDRFEYDLYTQHLHRDRIQRLLDHAVISTQCHHQLCEVEDQC